jgi:hypothetical protein
LKYIKLDSFYKKELDITIKELHLSHIECTSFTQHFETSKKARTESQFEKALILSKHEFLNKLFMVKNRPRITSYFILTLCQCQRFKKGIKKLDSI